MPKHNKKRRHSRCRSRSSSRCRSRSGENGWLEKKLADLQKQLDELNASAPVPNVAPSIANDDGLSLSDVLGTDENKENPPIQTNISLEVTEPVLGDDLLQILGTVPEQNLKSGPPLHTAIASRWGALLKNGLDSATKEEISRKYQVPENLSDLNVPQLNPEVSAAISAQVTRRDERLVKKQNQLNSSISAIGQAISLLLVKEGGGQKCIELLSDAGRLLCDFSHSETTIRRDLISVNLNKDLRETLSGAPIDKYLFGATLEERLKTAKNLEKSSQDLKPSKPQISKKPLQPLNNKGPIRPVRGARIGQPFRTSPYQRPAMTHHQESHHFKKPQDTVREARKTKMYAHRYPQKQ